jgi:hypothetical protein
VSKGGVKVAVWVVILLACAGAGAFVASRSDPFPPGVEDPGARPTGSGSTTSPTPSVELTPPDVTLRLRIASEHELHVGGSCFSDWNGSIPLHRSGDERVDGQGELLLDAGGCAFDTAQVQTVLVVVSVSGTLEGGRLQVRLVEMSSAPLGSQDLGGLVATLGAIRPAVDVRDGAGRQTVRVERPDGDRGRYVSATDVLATCRTC